jgi:hypothetical protein
MSFKAMTWAASVKTQTPIQKLILLMLSDKASDEGFCWPTMQSVADDCCMSRSCVLENIKKLSSLGFIQVEKRTVEMEDGGVRNTSNLYRVCVGEYPLGKVSCESTIVVQNDTPQSTIVAQDYKGSRLKRPGVVVQDDNRTSNLEPVIEPVRNNTPLSPIQSAGIGLEKTTPNPPPAKSLEDVIKEFNLSTKRRESLDEWLIYKREKKQGYKPTGLRALLRAWSSSDDTEFASAVDRSMAANYSGIFKASSSKQSSAGWNLPEEF